MREEIDRRRLEHQVSIFMWQEVERREPLRPYHKRLSEWKADLADQLACYQKTPHQPKHGKRCQPVSDRAYFSKIIKRGGVVALLGPTGVGKTTTVAKLAARAAMEYG